MPSRLALAPVLAGARNNLPGGVWSAFEGVSPKLAPLVGVWCGCSAVENGAALGVLPGVP